jgi:hypothetical protein
MKHPFIFEPTAILINADLSQAKIGPAIFSVERRADIPFSENIYFSSAPLRTSEHLDVVKEFEASLLGYVSYRNSATASSGPGCRRLA